MNLGKFKLDLVQRVQSTYRMLRRDLSPKEACQSIADAEGQSLEHMRMMVSFKAPQMICSRCWKEFKRRGDSYAKCADCFMHYRRSHYREKYRRRKGIVNERRFMTNDELSRYARRSLGMTAQQFGEALADVVVRPTAPAGTRGM